MFLSMILFGQVWDLDRPFECDAELKILKFDDDEAKQVANYGIFVGIILLYRTGFFLHWNYTLSGYGDQLRAVI